MKKWIFLFVALSAFVPAALAVNPVPFLSQPLVPASVAPGSAAFTLTVNGTGFVSASVVNWNGKAQPTTFVNQGQLKAQISSLLIAQAGTASITVSSGGVASNTVPLPILAPVSTVRFASQTGSAKGAYMGNVTTADLNGDGKLDLITSTGDNMTWAKVGGVGVQLGNGDGSFQRFTWYQTGLYPAALIGDLNGDGIPDIVTTTAVPHTYITVSISVLIGNGDGTFQPAKDYATPLSFQGSNSVLADFNGDGKLDLAFEASEGVAVLPGNGDGTFGAPIISPIYITEGLQIAVGDFNGDGKLDLAYGSFASLSMWVTLGNGDGTFQSYITLFPNGIADGVAVADFNGDGILDLVTSSQTGVSVLFGLGDGNFREGVVSYDIPNVTDSIAIGDFNGDGKLDVLLAHHNESHVSCMLGNGDGTFQPPKVFNRPLALSLATGDFNGDGFLDFAFVLDNGSDNGNSSVNVDLQMVP